MWFVLSYYPCVVTICCGRGETAIVLGRVTEVTVAVSVRNVGESAYLARLIATFDESVIFNVVAEVRWLSDVSDAMSLMVCLCGRTISYPV